MEVRYKNELWYQISVRRSYFYELKASNPQTLVNITRKKEDGTNEYRSVLIGELTAI